MNAFVKQKKKNKVSEKYIITQIPLGVSKYTLEMIFLIYINSVF